jgi:multiple sugar transport system permease protein
MMLVPAAALVLPLFLEMAALDLVDTPWSVILPLGLFPFGVYLAFLYYQANLPRELIEAGRLDGCSEARLFLSIGCRWAGRAWGWSASSPSSRPGTTTSCRS